MPHPEESDTVIAWPPVSVVGATITFDPGPVIVCVNVKLPSEGAEKTAPDGAFTGTSTHHTVIKSDAGPEPVQNAEGVKIADG